VDQVARTGLDDVVTEQRAHPALEDVAVLVLARVPVQRRRQRARRHRMLDEREALGGLRPVDHEADADAPEEALLRVLGADELRARGGHVHVSSLSLDSGVAGICSAWPARASSTFRGHPCPIEHVPTG
jgi:hypothetical protein